MVLANDGELAVALRERLDRAWVTVLDATAGDPMGVVAACQPWPWMLVGAVGDVPPALLALVRQRPVLLRWLGAVPDGMPRHCRRSEQFDDLAAAAASAIGTNLDGVRLAPGTGVTVAGGVHVSAELEALLGESPLRLDLPRSRFRHAEALLQRSAPHLRVTSSDDGTRLERC